MIEHTPGEFSGRKWGRWIQDPDLGVLISGLETEIGEMETETGIEDRIQFSTFLPLPLSTRIKNSILNSNPN